jgi:uncharacterized protein YqeY
MQEQIDRDLKAAMLSGDKQKVEVLRGLKSAMQYEALNLRTEDRKLSDEQALKVVARESKKRQETAELYRNNDEANRAEAELNEKKVIDEYLPEQLSEEDITKVVDEEVGKLSATAPSDMGKVISAVRGRLGAQADGATIARLVKERLSA